MLDIDEDTKRVLEGFEREKARTGPPEGFPGFPVIPGERYTDSEFQKLEIKHLWHKSWVYACHSDQLPEKGSYFVWDKLKVPIVIVNSGDDKIKAYYNTCRHRGAPVVNDKSGKARLLVCTYHGWSYDLDGNLINLRDPRDFVDLDKSCQSLIEVSCDRLGNWIFINLDPDAEPLKDYLGILGEHMEQFQPDKLRHVHSKSYPVNSNVKVLLDAFLEVYHVPSIHKKTVSRFIDIEGTYINLWPNGHSRMVTPHRDPDWRDPGAIGLKEIETVSEIPKHQNASYSFFPNLVTPPAATGIPFLTFWPTSDDTCEIDVHWFSPDWGDGGLPEVWQKRIENFENILFEDTQFAPDIQASVASPGFKGVLLNYQERRIYYWHEELDKKIGHNNMDQDYSIPKVLSPFIEK